MAVSHQLDSPQRSHTARRSHTQNSAAAGGLAALTSLGVLPGSVSRACSSQLLRVTCVCPRLARRRQHQGSVQGLAMAPAAAAGCPARPLAGAAFKTCIAGIHRVNADSVAFNIAPYGPPSLLASLLHLCAAQCIRVLSTCRGCRQAIAAQQHCQATMPQQAGTVAPWQLSMRQVLKAGPTFRSHSCWPLVLLPGERLQLHRRARCRLRGLADCWSCCGSRLTA